MLHLITSNLVEQIHFLNILKYITFRSIAAFFTAFLFTIYNGRSIIQYLKSKQNSGQPIRKDGPESHIKTKKGTPTMGGLMIILSILITALLWCDIRNPYVLLILFTILSFSIIGFTDDYLKISRNNSNGIKSKTKFILQLIFALITIAIIILIRKNEIHSTMQNELLTDQYSVLKSTFSIALPFVKNFKLDLGLLYIPFGIFIIVGSSNAVNLTDGLDGLVTVPLVTTLGCFGIISYLTGNKVFAHYLQLPHIKDLSELVVLIASIIGGSLGFLWYNAHPAKIFMGDVGSLSLGATIGVISIATRHEILLAIIGGVFLIEALSVILQILSFKIRGKRLFQMSPIHHHFEKIGWKESTIIIRFWILSVVLSLLGIATLKIR